MLDSLITSKTRVKLLLKFFMNTGTQAYLRGLADELGESTNAVRVELNRLTEAGFLESENNGRTKLYQANANHPLFSDLHNLVKKYLGIDKVEYFLKKLGRIESAFITGDYAKGMDTGIIDLVVVGEIDREYLNRLVDKTEKAIKRKIRVLVLKREECEELRGKLSLDKALVVWQNSEEDAS